jgi:archaellum component FlaG (FlaF/FlaG flagellin family)
MAKKAFVYDGTNWIDIAQSTADLSGYPALATNQFSFRNKIINGDFRINQRAYTSASNLASGSYGFDRWKSTFTNTTLTFTSAPQGQMVTINSGGSVEQIIERENMPAGTYVLSWTGTATGRVYNTGATPPSYAASPILVTLDGSANVEVEFTASGGTRTLQNVQLEPGNVASAFEYRPISTELALCQRYYEKSYDFGTNPGTATNQGRSVIGTPVAGTGYITMSVSFSVEKRAKPSVNSYDMAGTIDKVTYGPGVSNNRTGVIPSSDIGTRQFRLYSDNSTSKDELDFHWVASAEL